MPDTREKLMLHAIPHEAVLRVLSSKIEGLQSSEAEHRLKTHGLNRLPSVPKRSSLVRFLSQFHNVLIYVLIASAAVTAFMQHWIDSGVIVAVTLGNAIVGFLQEGRAEAAMDAIKGMLAPHAAVLRDGRRTSVDASALVPGDIVQAIVYRRI
jgi:magnesium-transporting ATPase (P-type)